MLILSCKVHFVGHFQYMTDVFSLCHHVDIDSYDALYARFEGWAAVWPWQAPIFWMCAFVVFTLFLRTILLQSTR